MIPTDMCLFGFPVWFDWRVDRNVVELRNTNGHRIRIEIQPQKPEASSVSDTGAILLASPTPAPQKTKP